MTDLRSTVRRPVGRPGVWTDRARSITHQALMAPAASAAGAVSVLAYVRQVSPYEVGSYPTCPFLAITGWYCPGCGSLRALYELAGLDLVGAMGMNPLAPPAVLFLVVAWALWTVRSATGRPRRWLAPSAALWALLVGIVLFAVARNIAVFAPWLAPGVG